MALIRQLLELHDSYRDQTAAPEALGDGYLYANNRIFRNVRDVFTALGGKLTSHDYCGYGDLPLAALPELVATKTLVYKRSADAYRKIEAARPGAFGLFEIPTQSQNYLTHESAHLIADQVLNDPKLDLTALDPNQAFVMKSLMAESFATSTETLGLYFLISPQDRAFYYLNSYITGLPPKLGGDVGVFNGIGRFHIKTAFELLYVGLLFSNFLFSKIKPDGRALILDLVFPNRKLNAEEKQVANSLIDRGFHLNESFRTKTNSYYFKSAGYTVPLTKLLDFNFLGLLYKTPALKACLNSFADILATGVHSDWMKQHQASHRTAKLADASRNRAKAA